jgi:hypothetical protein
MWPFSRDAARESVERLDKFLRTQIEQAALEYDQSRPSLLSQVFAGKKKQSPLALPPAVVSGFRHMVRAAASPAATPEAVVYSTAANVAIDMFSGYYDKLDTSVRSKNAGSETLLSFHLISDNNVAGKLKESVGRMRYCIQKTIVATAQYIEMGEFASLEEVLRETPDQAKQQKTHKFVDSQYRLHVSYRSMAISLQLFAAVNQELLNRIQREKISNPAKAHRSLVTNAVFVYEIADLIIAFLEAFELQGIPELHQLHQQAMGEVAEGRIESDESIERLDNLARSGRTTFLRLEDERRAARERRDAFDQMESAWTDLMAKIDNAQHGMHNFKHYIEEFEIIKLSARTNIRILNLMSVTKMIQQNIESTQQMMLQVDQLRLPSITADDVRRYLNLSPLSGTIALPEKRR